METIYKNERTVFKIMIEQDTIKLLRECDSGVKMGILSIDDVTPHVKSERMNTFLERSRDEHTRIEDEIRSMLNDYSDSGKEPGAIVKGMSWMKTNMKLAMNDNESTIADLMTDGCNMGIKSLSKYLNQYTAAEERAKDITKKIIAEEERLAQNMRDFL